ncbi:MAG: hypothetical protein ACHQUC_06480 [Chlamydiales bacterium]
MEENFRLRDFEEGAKTLKEKDRWAGCPKYVKFIGPSLMLIGLALGEIHSVSPIERSVLIFSGMWWQFYGNYSKFKFLGSTFVLFVGAFYLGIASLQMVKGMMLKMDPNPIPWIEMILASLAYKSLKKRSLGLVETTSTRQFLEVLAMIFILGLAGIQKDSLRHLPGYHVLYLIIPIWAFLAYGILFFRKS